MFVVVGDIERVYLWKQHWTLLKLRITVAHFVLIIWISRISLLLVASFLKEQHPYQMPFCVFLTFSVLIQMMYLKLALFRYIFCWDRIVGVMLVYSSWIESNEYQKNVTEWSDMSTPGLLCEWASTIKIQQSILV